jgi:hypothetical protein
VYRRLLDFSRDPAPLTPGERLRGGSILLVFALPVTALSFWASRLISPWLVFPLTLLTWWFIARLTVILWFGHRARRRPELYARKDEV